MFASRRKFLATLAAAPFDRPRTKSLTGRIQPASADWRADQPW